jgi:hypothetical protein
MTPIEQQDGSPVLEQICFTSRVEEIFANQIRLIGPDQIRSAREAVNQKFLTLPLRQHDDEFISSRLTIEENLAVWYGNARELTGPDLGIAEQNFIGRMRALPDFIRHQRAKLSIVTEIITLGNSGENLAKKEHANPGSIPGIHDLLTQSRQRVELLTGYLDALKQTEIL